MTWLKKQIAEIQNRRELRWYGAALGFTHILTLFFWRGGATLREHVQDPIAICWPFFSNCEVLRPFWQSFVTPVFCVYALVAIFATLLWIQEKTTPQAYMTLLLATILKIALYLIDYREMGNYHYMPYFVSFAFLFLSNKVEVIRFLIVGFYLGAGLLKFNREWLSGSALFNNPILHGRWRVFGCVATVFLEMVISFGLLSRRRGIFIFAFVCFAIFHLFSWHIVGFFYPLVMYALLSLFLLDWHFSNDRTDFWDFLEGRCKRSTYFCLIFFGLMQLPPFFSNTDSAITGEGRITSLNMFDARIVCQSHVWVNKEDAGVISVIDIQNPLNNLGTRIRCEPWVYREFARSICRLSQKDPTFRSVDIDLMGKRSSELQYQILLHETDVCGGR